MEDLIVQESEKFIRDLFEKEIQEKLRYHDIIHTEYVAGMADRIGNNSGLSKEELQIVIVAAWFHDSGFVSRSDGHEEESQNIARKFLSSKEMPEEFIDKVLICIEATKMPQNPGDNLLAQVVCDADMAYLSEDFYMRRTILLRKEWNHESKTKLSKKSYYQETVDLFKNHKYYTEYGENELSPGKAKNFKLLHKLKKKKSKKGSVKAKQLQSDNKKLIKKLEKEKLPGRGVESMLRLTARNQINLSSIADNKANILISINSIVLTVLLSIGIGKISDYPVITFPAIVFIITCLSTIIFAILSTRPKFSSGKFTEEDIHNKKVNLLFFGNFYNMEMEDYEWAVKEMMADQDYLYSSMIRDQYSLGKVISKKYKLLRIAYTIFMIGLILSSLLFAVFVLFVS
jgi:predicted metal-dependent HD superfamily phosphohydrolase